MMMLFRLSALTGLLILLTFAPAPAQQPNLTATLSRMHYREIGPALMGGRISDLAVVESKPQVFFLGTASGGLEDRGPRYILDPAVRWPAHELHR